MSLIEMMLGGVVLALLVVVAALMARGRNAGAGVAAGNQNQQQQQPNPAPAGGNQPPAGAVGAQPPAAPPARAWWRVSVPVWVRWMIIAIAGASAFAWVLYTYGLLPDSTAAVAAGTGFWSYLSSTDKWVPVAVLIAGAIYGLQYAGGGSKWLTRGAILICIAWAGMNYFGVTKDDLKSSFKSSGTSTSKTPAAEVPQMARESVVEHRLLWKQSDGSLAPNPVLNQDSEEVVFGGGCKIAETIGGFGNLYHARVKGHDGSWKLITGGGNVEMVAAKVVPISPNFTGGSFKIRCPA